MPPDVNESYDPPVDHPGVIDAEVLRNSGQRDDPLFSHANTTSLGAPVPQHEPPIYTVLVFRINHGGKAYDYAAVRSVDGKWYATGGETKQGVDWPTLARAIRARLVGPVQVMGLVRSLFL